jgi:serine/threonine protein kinase
LVEFCQASIVTEMTLSFGKGIRISQIVGSFPSVCAAVHLLHTQSPAVVHRHLTPQNIVTAANGWKIVDWGSANY